MIHDQMNVVINLSCCSHWMKLISLLVVWQTQQNWCYSISAMNIAILQTTVCSSCILVWVNNFHFRHFVGPLWQCISLL